YLAAFAGGAGAAAHPATPELFMERVLDAPRNLVFDAWSTPQHLAHWWGPKGFTLPSCTVEFHAGGAFRFVFRGPDGTDYPFVGKYLEVARPERIVFKGVIHNTPGQEVLTTVTFEEHRGKTTLRVHQTYSFESDATRGAREGWTQTLDRLAEYLAGA
ncbi:MAG TPA: SRPBCC domain-containing protein, partial [bacterium]|nr:SRPBCC domain-containing protein [bacterium]